MYHRTVHEKNFILRLHNFKDASLASVYLGISGYYIKRSEIEVKYLILSKGDQTLIFHHNYIL